MKPETRQRSKRQKSKQGSEMSGCRDVCLERIIRSAASEPVGMPSGFMWKIVQTSRNIYRVSPKKGLVRQSDSSLTVQTELTREHSQVSISNQAENWWVDRSRRADSEKYGFCRRISFRLTASSSRNDVSASELQTRQNLQRQTGAISDSGGSHFNLVDGC